MEVERSIVSSDPLASEQIRPPGKSEARVNNTNTKETGNAEPLQF